MSLETANAINTLMLFSSDIRCSTGLNPEEFAITPANLTMPDSSQTGRNILVTVCDKVVSMPISASKPLSATVSSRLKALREVIQESAKASILTIEIDADPTCNNLLGWSKLHVHEPKKFNQSIRKMVLTDHRDIWNRTCGVDQWVLKRRELQGFAIVNQKKHPHPWDTHYQFSIKILLSKQCSWQRHHVRTQVRIFREPPEAMHRGQHGHCNRIISGHSDATVDVEVASTTPTNCTVSFVCLFVCEATTPLTPPKPLRTHTSGVR